MKARSKRLLQEQRIDWTFKKILEEEGDWRDNVHCLTLAELGKKINPCKYAVADCSIAFVKNMIPDAEIHIHDPPSRTKESQG